MITATEHYRDSRILSMFAFACVNVSAHNARHGSGEIKRKKKIKIKFNKPTRISQLARPTYTSAVLVAAARYVVIDK